MTPTQLAPAPLLVRPTVLLVEDDEAVLTLLRLHLERGGYEVVGARRASEARKALATRRFSAVVVDGLLPDATGFSLIQQMRISEELRASDENETTLTPVAFISAFWRDRASFRSLSENLGVKCILYKPFPPGDLVAWLHGVAPVARSTEPTPRELAAAQEEFSRTLPRRLEALAALLRELSGKLPSADPERTSRARTEAHQLRGTCGSFGYPDLGLAAGLVEDRLAGAQANSLPLRFEDLLPFVQPVGERAAPRSLRAPVLFLLPAGRGSPATH